VTTSRGVQEDTQPTAPAVPETPAHLLAVLRDPSRFGFYDLVRLLEELIPLDGRARAPGAGGRLRFEQAPDLSFPASDIASVELADGEARVMLTFLGLLGTASPLAPEWSEEVLLADDEGALRAFYDAFHHRAASILFAAWKANTLEGAYDLDGTDALSQRLRSLVGVDAWARPEAQEALSPMEALGLADYYRGHPHTIDAHSAERLLRRLLPSWNVRLETNVRRFVLFGGSDRARLGVQRCRLGSNLVYGDGSDESEGLLRVHVGPVDRATYESLMPEGAAYEHLQALAHRVLAGAVDMELEVHVSSEEAPRCALGTGPGARLGVDARYSTEGATSLRVRVPLKAGTATASRTFVQ
jgi:type VI secretion system protein ImpH